MLATLGVLIGLFTPFLLAVFLWRSRPKTRLEWIVQAWFTLSFTLYIFMAGRWDFLSYPFRYIVVGLVLAGAVRSFLGVWRAAPFYDPALPGVKTSLATYAVPSLVFTVLCAAAIRGLFYTGPVVSLAFPLKDGTYYMAQAGGTTLMNYHHPYGAQAYSLDIVRLDSWGRRAAGLTQASLDRYAIFGTPVFSPCDGTVSEAVDGIADLAPGAPGDTEHAAGNHVFIDCQGFEVLLAHMKEDSLLVSQGDALNTGDPIGQVGNSGNTSEPHLHIHAQTGRIPGSLVGGTGLAILFDGRFLARNHVKWMKDKG